MINRPFDLIERCDIDDLVNNEVREDRTLEYKESLPTASREDRKEFLADVSSFANTGGGDILYGIPERRTEEGKKTGLPEPPTGIKLVSVEEEIRRLDQLIQTGLAPKLTVQIRAIEGFSKGPVIVVRVPKSWSAPHMLAVGESRFYSRTNVGRQPLDVWQIRSAFAASEAISERISRFREERCTRIVNGETPVPLSSNPKIVLHIVPLAALDPLTKVDSQFLKSVVMPLIYTSVRESQFNLEGVLSSGLVRDGSCLDYVQLYRNGCVEAVDSGLIIEHDNGIKYIPAIVLEYHVMKAFGAYLDKLNHLDIPLPLVFAMTLIGVKGYKLLWRREEQLYPEVSKSVPMDRNVLPLPDLLIDNYSLEPSTALRPVFDVLWQAGGWPQCMDYDEQGKWIGKMLYGSALD